MTLVALGSLASTLDDQPWLMPRACTAGERSPAQVIERHLRAARAKTVVVATPAGGFGNVRSTVTHAFLRALIIGSQLVVRPAGGVTLQHLAPSPLWTLADSEALRRLSSANVSLLRVPQENFLPLSPFCSSAHSLWQQLSNVTHNIPDLVRRAW